VEAGDILRSFYGSIYHRPMNVSPIDELVLGSARPMSRQEVEWLRDSMGVKAILSLTETPLPESWLEGIVYKDVPVRNHTSPRIGVLQESVEFLLERTTSKQRTTVHCTAGKGRTGTVLAAYLCAKYGSSAQDAIDQVRAKRPGSIERTQEKAIFDYKELLETNRKSTD
jgi:atypical dual specificity phosphatase